MLGVACQVGRAEEGAPKDNKGFSTVKTETVELGSEIEGMNRHKYERARLPLWGSARVDVFHLQK